jgi:TRAP-type C4-dicarboxylate transport system permease large subunit
VGFDGLVCDDFNFSDDFVLLILELNVRTGLQTPPCGGVIFFVNYSQSLLEKDTKYFCPLSLTI